jgi:HEAT repeat protein
MPRCWSGISPGAFGKNEDVPALVKALTHAHSQVRAEAAEELTLVGPPAAEVVPALLKRAKNDPEPVTRLVAARAVAAILYRARRWVAQ